MSVILHPATGFPVGDPAVCPLSLESLPSLPEIEEALGSLILSASGWRKVFAADGDEDSLSTSVSRVDLFLAACMARAFALRLRDLSDASEVDPDGAAPVVALGIDSRPTGPAIADVMARVFLASGVGVRYPFIIAAPEIMAWTRSASSLPRGSDGRLDGFCYISASHNPPGHNGVKFGFRDGGVLPGSEAASLAADFLSLARGASSRELVADLVASARERDVSRVFVDSTAEKRKAVSAYTLFARRTVADEEDLAAQEKVLDAVCDSVRSRPIGVVAEMNGSARSLSIDEDFLSMLGAKCRLVNARPRVFAHRIVPEGASLDLCRSELERARAEDPSFVLGYVPDCDGDRGNLVRWDSRSGGTIALEAQEVFSLAVLAELSSLADSGGTGGKPVAVAVNDATSLRVDSIARAFGAEVRRAETGEANVVNLARSLRGQGYVVRILGEGSNGGNITHPAAVRDPLNTVAALLKLLSLRGGGAAGGLFRAWLSATGRESDYSPDFTLDDVIESLPEWTTTSVFEERALMRIPKVDHAALKRSYQGQFLPAWEARKGELKTRFGFHAWEAWASVGSGESGVSEDFCKAGSGGLKLLFRDASGAPAGFLWMRGSGTESVLRVMADLRGRNPEGEAYLLDWQRSMVESALAAL